MSIQSSINSMIGSASHAVMAVKGYQALKAKQAAKAAAPRTSVQQMAADRAKQSAADAVEAKRRQRRDFMSYLQKQQSSLGRVGDLAPQLQKKIAQQYSPSQRRRLMDLSDKEAKRGKHK